jgi:hypothetical protein
MIEVTAEITTQIAVTAQVQGITPTGDECDCELPIDVVNSNGDILGTITTQPYLDEFELDDIEFEDVVDIQGTYAVPTRVIIETLEASVSVSMGGEWTITPVVPPAPTAIAPMFIPATQKTVYFTGKLDEGGRIAAGDFDLPSGDFAEQQGSDYATATPFLNLLHNNEFGNKSAFCDTVGNALNYASSTPANNIVLHTGYRRMWYVVRTAATDVDDALDLAAAASHGGFTDWRIPTRAEIHTLFDYDNVNSLSTSLGKPPAFTTTSLVNVTTCTTNSLSTSQIFITFSNGGRQTTPTAANTSKNFILVRTY